MRLQSHTQHHRPLSILRIDASARDTDSISRQLGDKLENAIMRQSGELRVTRRDLAERPPAFVDAGWIDANFIPAEQRNISQQAALAESDCLVHELMNADVLVIGAPVYNFSIPAVLKAWIDMVARARLTFRYTENGPEGLLEGKRAYVIIATGGMPVGSDADFASAYLRHILGFLGISDVTIIAADQLSERGDAAISAAARKIDTLFPRRRDADANVNAA